MPARRLAPMDQTLVAVSRAASRQCRVIHTRVGHRSIRQGLLGESGIMSASHGLVIRSERIEAFSISYEMCPVPSAQWCAAVAVVFVPA